LIKNSLSFVENVIVFDVISENERCNGRKLDQNVNGWAGGIL